MNLVSLCLCTICGAYWFVYPANLAPAYFSYYHLSVPNCNTFSMLPRGTGACSTTVSPHRVGGHFQETPSRLLALSTLSHQAGGLIHRQAQFRCCALKNQDVSSCRCFLTGPNAMEPEREAEPPYIRIAISTVKPHEYR